VADGASQFPFETGDALLVVDVINDFAHDDGPALLSSFEERVDGMKGAISEARAAAVPVIYVNDDHGRWDSNVSALIGDTIERGAGGRVIKQVTPQEGDPLLLKQRYSGFDHTSLDLLLERLEIKRVVLIGAATEGCVVQTAIDAREHGLQATILASACATTDPALEAIALDYAEQVGGIRVAGQSGLTRR
jgi:nicotinamidase-related amidase